MHYIAAVSEMQRRIPDPFNSAHDAAPSPLMLSTKHATAASAARNSALRWASDMHEQDVVPRTRRQNVCGPDQPSNRRQASSVRSISRMSGTVLGAPGHSAATIKGEPWSAMARPCSAAMRSPIQRTTGTAKLFPNARYLLPSAAGLPRN